VNSRPSPHPPTPAVANGRPQRAATPRLDDPELGPVGLQTRTAVIEAGHQVFVERGYYGTRVDDIARAAGVSHGVFYRYFENKNHLFRLLAARASERLSAAFDQVDDIDLTGPDASAELRAWLHRYAVAHWEEAAILRVWTDAILRDPELGSASIDAIATSRASLLGMLRHRGFGDLDAEAVALLVLLEAMVAGVANEQREARVASLIERSVVCLGDGEARSPNRRRLRLGAR
jgi:AcrR family transcriptional regulator